MQELKWFSASCILSPDCTDCRRYSISAELEFGNREYAMSRRGVAECCVARDRVNRSREKAASDASCILRGRKVSDAVWVSCSAFFLGSGHHIEPAGYRAASLVSRDK